MKYVTNVNIIIAYVSRMTVKGRKKVVEISKSSISKLFKFKLLNFKGNYRIDLIYMSKLRIFVTTVYPMLLLSL